MLPNTDSSYALSPVNGHFRRNKVFLKIKFAQISRLRMESHRVSVSVERPVFHFVSFHGIQQLFVRLELVEFGIFRGGQCFDVRHRFEVFVRQAGFRSVVEKGHVSNVGQIRFRSVFQFQITSDFFPAIITFFDIVG